MKNAEVKGLFFDIHFAKGSIVAILYGVFFYIGQRISGAHLNPCVSFGLSFTSVLKTSEAIIYAITQITAGLIGALFYLVFIVNLEDENEPEYLEPMNRRLNSFPGRGIGCLFSVVRI